MTSGRPSPPASTRAARREAARHGALEGSRLIGLGAAIAAEAARDWERAPFTIGRSLRELRGLASAERWLLGEMIHGWLRHRRRLAWEIGGEDVAAMLRRWLEESPDLVGEEEAALAGMAPERREGNGERAFHEISDPIERLGLALSYPDWMVGRAVAQLGLAEGERLLEAMNRRAPLTARANRLRGKREALAARLGEEGIVTRPTRLARDGLHLETRRNVYDLPAFRDGSFELQDEGSQLVAELVAPPPGGRVIDACAGAGGKSLALASTMMNQGRIAALDVSQRKLDELRQRARRAGVTNLQATVIERDGPLLFAPADRVVVDAPCSGLGVVRRNPETKWRLAPADITELAALQLVILERGAPLVRPGGRIVYATCSILEEENGGVVTRFLERHPEFVLMPAKEILGRERAASLGDGEVLRLWPQIHDTDGFFAAVLRRVR